MAEAGPVAIGIQLNAPLRQEEVPPYIDFLLLGKTGSGKSTTVDKLVTANIYGTNYVGTQHSEPQRLGDRVKMEDITLWNLPGHKNPKQVEDRMKRALFHRAVSGDYSQSDSDEEYDSPDSITTHCELLGNEISRLRVLDVPGFDASTSYHLPAQVRPNGEGVNPLELKANNQQQQNFIIMRQILRIQANKSLAFQRILYFLPCRGPPERADANLQNELALIRYYFGDLIFDIMIMVATNPSSSSQRNSFKQRDMQKTKRNVKRALELVFMEEREGAVGLEVENPIIPEIPIVYISLEDTGKEIYDKLGAAYVVRPTREGFRLKFREKLCTRCATEYGLVRNECLVCFEDVDGKRKEVPYDESKCHPLIIPKYSKLKKVLGGIGYIVFLGIPYVAGAKWPWFTNNDEICVQCERPPGTPGCKKVLEEVNLVKGSPAVKVNHTSDVDPTVLQADE